MRQVPRYLLIGDGRLARHFRHYFSLLELPYLTWSRRENSPEKLAQQLNFATHVLLLISDSAIEAFIETHQLADNKSLTVMHCSGCLQTDKAISTHPLQTFSDALYGLQDYQEVPFIIENTALTFSQLLPGLTNPYYFINPEKKPYYHALCVMANNFTTILWQKYFKTMQQQFAIDKKDLLPIFKRTMENLQYNNQNVLTGPIARKDQQTINNNLTALQQDPFYSIYKAFSETHLEELQS